MGDSTQTQGRGDGEMRLPSCYLSPHSSLTPTHKALSARLWRRRYPINLHAHWLPCTPSPRPLPCPFTTTTTTPATPHHTHHHTPLPTPHLPTHLSPPTHGSPSGVAPLNHQLRLSPPARGVEGGGKEGGTGERGGGEGRACTHKGGDTSVKDDVQPANRIKLNWYEDAGRGPATFP
ncbi:hypothetical protein E2C01_022890 [Portunus trituberculatus]|uniref:Uncharacterized protein n=1 Tax=Portunus trituberculatus TaxID=210409 RepID=A0A5B7E8V6_PORTR|nr:hypothetical protein [Portunus trituberculatus]